jgi:hypothetical protein
MKYTYLYIPKYKNTGFFINYISKKYDFTHLVRFYVCKMLLCQRGVCGALNGKFVWGCMEVEGGFWGHKYSYIVMYISYL